MTQEEQHNKYNPFLSGTGENNFSGKEGFLFEEDFVEEHIRCIPMIVRFKMDLAGIKLKLAEWSKFDAEERAMLMSIPVMTASETSFYRNYLQTLVLQRTGKGATDLQVDENPPWADKEKIPEMLKEKAGEYQWEIAINQWKKLSNLQRFVLCKLCRPGHENKNFPKAMKELGLV
ncbi:MAG: hypothetical protein RLZZ28_1954 [Bacteroidota bacterium]|jgi:hypothetical protein